ncbi:MAG: RidA family protein [Pseudomonadales bacterium]|jgi:enamine deaminase RidA (YjgF/YER057c/UK114 family)
MNISRHYTSERMSKIVVYNNLIYLCGQVASDATSGIAVQTESMLGKVDDLLEEANSDKYHILSATVYLSDMDNFNVMNEVWEWWLPLGHAPARACVQAPMARPELLVEVSVIAAVKES